MWDAIPSWPRLATEFPIYWSSDEAIPLKKKSYEAIRGCLFLPSSPTSIQARGGGGLC